MTSGAVELLGPADIRALAQAVGLRPSKTRGQNFVHDANTVRRIVDAARLTPGEVVLEIGPGLGSLTLGLLAAGSRVVAVEIESALAAALPSTATAHGAVGDALTVIDADALTIGTDDLPGPPPTALVANLPYNVAVPVLLHLLAVQPDVRHGLVMVQAEVADRLVAPPGSRTYGTPSVKLAWYAHAGRAGAVPRAVFWPVPNVESTLVRWERHDPPQYDASWPGPPVARSDVFAVVDAAFAQRRKTLRSALARLAGSAVAAEAALVIAGIDPQRRGETLTVEEFARVASALTPSSS